jgi:hypothetical protein
MTKSNNSRNCKSLVAEKVNKNATSPILWEEGAAK